jgi:6,7-dimethyl-8-ribityllumazine synthase
MAEFEGEPHGAGRSIAVVVSRFNQDVTRRLLEAALDALTRHGVRLADVDVIWVPGAWELPVAVRHALGMGRYDGVVALGAVIRGDTPTPYFAGGRRAALAAGCRVQMPSPPAPPTR